MKWIAFLVALATLTGCGANLTDYGNPRGPNFQSNGPLPEAGFTLAHSSAIHGIQIAYYGEGGEYALWYPGNRRALLGTWREGGRKTFCYTYRSNTFNPATGSSDQAGQEICNRYYGDGQWVAKVSGDVFDLRSGRLPQFDLTRCLLPPPLELMTNEDCTPAP